MDLAHVMDQAEERVGEAGSPIGTGEPTSQQSSPQQGAPAEGASPG